MIQQHTIFKKYRTSLILIFLSLLGYLATKLSPHFSIFIDKYYSQGINKYYRQVLSRFFGLFPFSVYEFLLYGIILFTIWYTIYRLMRTKKQPATWKQQLGKWFIHLLNLALVLWCLLIYTWTPNYARPPLQATMSINLADNDQKDLILLYDHIIQKLNQLADQVERDSSGYMTISGGYQDVFARTQSCYDALSQDYPQFSGNFGPPKPIAMSGPMLYTYITGIYSPFTTEPNVNTAILPQSLPATVLHEMAHQRGYALEDECNFIATLACTYSQDADFQYSGYLLAYIYASNALNQVSPNILHDLNSQLDDKVRLDINHHNTFWEAYKGKTQKISSTLNDSYLKANGITDGEASYGRMLDLLIAYYRMHPDF